LISRAPEHIRDAGNGVQDAGRPVRGPLKGRSRDGFVPPRFQDGRMDTLIRLSSADWSPIALLALLGVMYVTLSVKTRSATTSSRAMRIRRPGWIARLRARGGITHKRDRVGVGYTSATRSVFLSTRELAGHGFLTGGPGSGKTTALQLFVEAAAGGKKRMPVVIVDPKGSPALEETVRAHDGIVWTLDGKVPADLLDPRPWQVPDLLLEAEDYSADARAYRDAAHQSALWAAWALALRGEPMDLARLRALLDRVELLRALEPYRWRDPRVAEWVGRLEHQHGGIEDSGARGLDRALGTLLDGVALRGSLKHCAQAIRLEDVVEATPRARAVPGVDRCEGPGRRERAVRTRVRRRGRQDRLRAQSGVAARVPRPADPARPGRRPQVRSAAVRAAGPPADPEQE
jgi:hypothetical protein